MKKKHLLKLNIDQCLIKVKINKTNRSMNAVIECPLLNIELLSRFKIFVSPFELKKGI